MACELSVVIEALADHKPLLFIIEDLHWSDHATIELIGRLARRAERARLLIVGSFRSGDLPHDTRTILSELKAQFNANALDLPLLTESDVVAWLNARGTWLNVRRTARALHDRTEGNPLFLTHLLQNVIDTGQAKQRGGCWTLECSGDALQIPSSIEGVVTSRIAGLDSSECRLLELASVAGVFFSAATIAYLATDEVSAVDRTCYHLAERQDFIAAAESVEEADGAVSGGYVFRHQFYRDLFYARVTPSEKAELHRKIALRLEGLRCSDPAIKKH